jgi:hypothetical protein
VSFLSPGQLLDEASVGNDAGWALGFYNEVAGEIAPVPTLLVRREDYYAEIEATLPGDFSGGTYSFVIEGLIDDHYAAIAQGHDSSPTVVRLYLYWRDAAGSIAGYMASVAGLSDMLGPAAASALEPALVAELSILGVSRRTGTRMYEAVVTAQERVFNHARGSRLASALDVASVDDAVKQLAGELHVPCEIASAPAASTPPPADAARVAIERGTSYREALSALAARAELASGKAGRGMILIRKGKLYFGPREIPLEGEAKPLSALSGLVEVSRAGDETRDPNADITLPSVRAKTRAGYTLTLKGRPDIKPGDVVSLHVAKEDVSTTIPPNPLAAVAAPFMAPLGTLDEGEEKLVYVSSVAHRLGRTSAFVTTVAGLEIASSSDAWDKPSDGGSQPSVDGSSARGPSASQAIDAADAFKGIAENVVSAHRFPDVAEVRQVAVDDSVAERPRQTQLLWRGVEDADGGGRQAARLPVARKKPSPADAVPYLSPFAWGSCGLVLPRYPGTRVMLMHRNGKAEDPVDVGALWETKTGPDKAKPGDWWLILPVGVKNPDKASGTVPAAHKGEITNDLIDGDGNRVIEVGTLTIRIGKKGLNKVSGFKRPEPLTPQNENDQAHITVASDGAVTIHAAKNLTLKAPNGDIKLESKNVDVKVTTAMNVHT